MWSRVISLLALVSLLACCVSMVMWIRSYAGPISEITAHDGKLLLANFEMTPTSFDTLAKTNGGADALVISASGIGNVYRHALGFAYVSGNSFYQYRWSRPVFRIVVIPFWAIVLVTAALPTWWFRRRRRIRHWQRAGRCRACGYDLRGSPQQCPECGVPASAPQ